MTDQVKFEVDATYAAGESGQRFMLVVSVSGKSADAARTDVLTVMHAAGLVDPKVEEVRTGALPARQLEVLGAPIIGIARLCLA